MTQAAKRCATGGAGRVDRRLNVAVESARQDGLGRMLDSLGGGPDLGRVGDAAHSVQVRGGVTF